MMDESLHFPWNYPHYPLDKQNKSVGFEEFRSNVPSVVSGSAVATLHSVTKANECVSVAVCRGC